MLTLRFLSKEDWKTTKLPHLLAKFLFLVGSSEACARFQTRNNRSRTPFSKARNRCRAQTLVHFARPESSGLSLQAPSSISRYILDFVEHSARLVVELDGSQDAQPKHRAADEIRDRVLLSEGYRVLRCSNFDALTRPWGIAQSIVADVEDRRSGDEPKATLAPLGSPE